MTSTMVFLLIFIVICAGALPYIIRTTQWSKFLKYVNNEQYDKALEILDSRLFQYLYGQYNTNWNRFRIYIHIQDDEKLEEITHQMLYDKINKKQRYQIASNAYFYFLDRENKEMAKELLTQLKQCADAEEYEYDLMLYHVLIEKKSDDIENIQHLIDTKKEELKEDSVQYGILEYLLGCQYAYKKDKKMAEKYLNHAKNNLKGSPYHKKVKKLLNTL